MNLNIILVSPPWFPLQLRNDLYSDDSHSQTRFLEESNYVRNAGETTKHRNKAVLKIFAKNWVTRLENKIPFENQQVQYHGHFSIYSSYLLYIIVRS